MADEKRLFSSVSEDWGIGKGGCRVRGLGAAGGRGVAL